MKINIHIESDDPEEIHRITAALAGAKTVTKTVGNLSVTETNVAREYETIPPIVGKIRNENGEVVDVSQHIPEFDSSIVYKLDDIVMIDGIACRFEYAVEGEIERLCFVPINKGTP